MINMDNLQTFLQQRTFDPVVSVYLPQDPHQEVASLALQLRHLVAHAQEVMADTWPKQDFAPYQALFDTAFDTPKRLSDPHISGFGFLCDGQQLASFELETPVKEAAMVTADPQLLPLLADAQVGQDFDLLVLQQDKIALYRHEHDELKLVALPDDAPQTLTGALGDERRGGALNSVSQGPDAVSYHGHGDKSAEADIDLRRFFTAVDDYVATNYSKADHRPLALMGLSQNIAVFRGLSQNPYLTTVQLAMSPNHLTKTALVRAGRALREDFQAHARFELLEEIAAAQDASRLVSGPDNVAAALNQNAVAHLLLRSPARVNGLLVEGQIVTDTPQAAHNNVLNDLAIQTLIQGGKVSLMQPDELMADAVAIARYAQ